MFFSLAGLAGRLGTRHGLPVIRAATRATPYGWPRVGPGTSNQNTIRLRGRQLLDHEALTCLLVLLFVDEPKLNTNRLHRVLRNLCYHAQTRTWVIRSLLAILQRTSECKAEEAERPHSSSGKTSDKLKRKSSQGAAGSSSSQSESLSGGGSSRSDNIRLTLPSWLSISLDAVLGCRANVFQIQRSHGKKHSNSNTYVTIHHQASPIVCRHVLDTLISMAKSFPNHFLPTLKKAQEVKCESEKEKDSESKAKSNQSSPSRATKPEKQDSKTDQKDGRTDTDFWELLVKLDNISSSKKGKSVQKTHSNTHNSESENVVVNFDSSPLGQLMSMLAHPVVRRSQLLTDRLLRLLGLVSIGLPDVCQSSSASGGTATTNTTTTTTPAAVTPATANVTTTSNTAALATAVVHPAQQVLETQPAGATAPADTPASQQLNETMDTTAPPCKYLQPFHA